MKCQLLIIFFVISVFTSYSADVKFHNINDMHGTSIRETASICKDDNGFIWTSSKTGIVRFAGDDCRIYQLSYKATDIYKVNLVYQNHVLLAYTNNGQVFCYNTVYDRFDFLFYMGQILNNQHLVVTSILIQNQGSFWISSNMGLHKYQKGELFRIGNETSEILYAAWYGNSHILLAEEKAIQLMNINTMESKNIYENTNVPTLRISTLYYDIPDHKLWIGTVSDGLFHYDFNTNMFVRFPVYSFPRQPVRAITANSDSTLLVGIDGQGIWEVNKKGDRVLNIYKESPDNPFSLRGDGVYDIFCDPDDKRVWVCTYTGGLSFFVQTSPPVNQITHQVNNPNSLSNNIVNGIIEDKNGKIWFATDNGISCWDVQSGKWKTYYRNRQEQAQVFLSLCEDDNGRIWASTYSSGIYVIDAKTGKELAHHSKENTAYPLPSNFVFDIFKDCNGDLWIGSVTGNVICYISKENRFKPYPSMPVYAFAEFSSSKILMACTFGLRLLDKQTDKIEILLDGYMLQDILVSDGYVWLCSSGDGLIRFDPKNKTIEKFTTEAGLPSNYVNSIMEMDGYFWLGTEAGLCRFDPKDKTVQTYSSLLSLSDVSFNRHAHCKLRNGQLAWGTNKGVMLFDPLTLQQPQLEGRIFIQNIFVSGRSVRDNTKFKLDTPLDSLQKITLKYDQNNLTLELLPLGNRVSSSKFSWKIEGFDAGWSPASNHRMLTYTNIPNGKYILKIRMYGDALSKLADERQLLIHVTPPLWKTVWFRILSILFIGYIIYFMLRFYVNRLKQRHAEDKVRFFTNTAHDIRTALTLIKAPVEELNKESNLSETGKYYLHVVTEQARRLSSTATHLLDFQKADMGKGQLSLEDIDIVALIAHRKLMFESFAKSRQIELQFTSNPSVYPAAIDKSMIEKVIDNLISNAIKYSNPDSSVQILFDGDVKSWSLEVKDQGIGISPKAQRKLFHEFYRSENAVNAKIVGSGMGLLLAKNYITLHGGIIGCTSRENAGSSFKITVPLKKASEKNRKIHPAVSISTHETEQQSVRNEEIKQRDMRILIVEDNDDLRNFMFYPLRGEFHVSTAEDGEQAWKMIQKQQPDLVVSDVMMPNKNGFELCRLIKSTYETSHIPVILLTSLTEKAQQLHGLGLGADDYLTKPFDMMLLVQRIKSIIRNRKTIREKALKLIDENHNEPILANELNDKFVKKAVEVVCANMSDSEFGKGEFASAMNVSAPLLYKKIKSLTDQAPVDFIKTIRLNHALELLQSHRYTVTEVSELCGFASLGYFGRVFKKHFGKMPTDI